MRDQEEKAAPTVTGIRGSAMEYRQFGGTGTKVSAIGFGCWEISGTYGPICAAQFDPPG
jgi:hypothetical protein